MRPTLYIDFDHTLFDTEAFKHALAQSLRPFGITEQQFLKTYRARPATTPFSIPVFARALTPHGKMRRRITHALEQVTKKGVRFLYADVLPFLRLLKKRGVHCVLFTYGDSRFQRMKIASIPECRELFRRVIVTTNRKKDVSAIRVQIPAYIIDNRPEVVRAAARHCMIPFLLVRGRAPISRAYRAITHRSLRTIAKHIL